VTGLPILALDLRERLRPTLFWALGTVFLIAVTIASYPAIRDNPELASFAEDLPDFIQALVGEDLVSPAGYLNSQVYLSMLPILLLILAVGRAASTLAGEEQEGTLELTLAHPITRTRLLVEKFAGVVAAVAVLFVATWASTWLGALAVDMDISAGALAAGTLSVCLLALAFGSITFAIGAATGRRGVALGAGAGLAAVTWLLYGIAPLLGWDAAVQLSLWDHALGADPLANGFDASGTLVLAAITLIGFAVAVVAFGRRDIGTA